MSLLSRLSMLRDKTNKWPFRLGVAGLIPFYVGALGCVLAKDNRTASAWKQFNTKYGAVILSFTGAVHWGSALTTISAIRSRQFVFSVLPTLAGFGSLFWVQPLALMSQSAMFAAIPLFEYKYLPTVPWYMRLRLVLSGGAFVAQTICSLVK
eukprot:NODE_461_length_8173_cov_0.353604.p5 type:complete len:152 gc:universal NODE_461_length_8173_cov_0.353604:6766-7221(+)